MSILEQAIEEHRPAAVFALFSGGHDSLTATALAARHPQFTAAVHINTGIGIPDTREFVRETCQREGWPLLEMQPDAKTYDELVLNGRGFPSGPRSHNTMYYWLKQRQVRRLVRETKRRGDDRVALVTGVRAAESPRRMAGLASAGAVKREGAILWVNPVLDWSALECGAFMADAGLHRNTVVDLLHRSGECLCGALAHRDELKAIEFWFPAVAARIHALERQAQARGLRAQRWATPTSRAAYRQEQALALCSSCQLTLEEAA